MGAQPPETWALPHQLLIQKKINHLAYRPVWWYFLICNSLFSYYSGCVNLTKKPTRTLIFSKIRNYGGRKDQYLTGISVMGGKNRWEIGILLGLWNYSVGPYSDAYRHYPFAKIHGRQKTKSKFSCELWTLVSNVSIWAHQPIIEWPWWEKLCHCVASEEWDYMGTPWTKGSISLQN